MSDQQPVSGKNRDLIETLTWGAMFIWAGLVYLAHNLGWLNIGFSRHMGGIFSTFNPDLWGIILLGAGLIMLAGAIVRQFLPHYGRAGSGSFVLAAVLIGVGLSSMFSWNIIWPVVLIAIGIGILLRR